MRGRNSDNKLILEKLGWEPTIRLADGLKVTYFWIKEQLEAEAKASGERCWTLVAFGLLRDSGDELSLYSRTEVVHGRSHPHQEGGCACAESLRICCRADAVVLPATWPSLSQPPSHAWLFMMMTTSAQAW